MSSCPLGRRVDGVGVAPDLVSCLESRVYGAGGRRVEPAANGSPPVWWEVQNEHVGWGCIADAADANGSWAAETKQSDADRPMWVHVRNAAQIACAGTETSLGGGMSTRSGLRAPRTF